MRKGTIKPHLHLREGADDYNTFRRAKQSVPYSWSNCTSQEFSTFVMLTNFQVTINLILVPICLIPDWILNLDESLDKMVLKLNEAVSLDFRAQISLWYGATWYRKTTVICEIIQQLAVNQGLRVLMVAPTHIAVDNVLERICLVDGQIFYQGHTPYDTPVVALFLAFANVHLGRVEFWSSFKTCWDIRIRT